MLSYMLPVDEKPPPGPGKGHLQLNLASGPVPPLVNGRSLLSKDNSVNSFASDSSVTPSGAAKPKIFINGGKHQSLKRVSFGSSKGSMVETLIYETPLQEEPEPSPIPENGTTPFPEDKEQEEDERERVRVKFFQQSKPQEVDLPDEPLVFGDCDFVMASAATVAISDSNHVTYNRQESTDSGWENPFRPGGDLSREADEIVELIKGGKPITPTPGSAPPLPTLDQNDIANSEPLNSPKRAVNNLHATPTRPGSKNGNVKADGKTQNSPGPLEVQRATTVQPVDASQVEHVVIKKKPKCKCCVIQ